MSRVSLMILKDLHQLNLAIKYECQLMKGKSF